MPYNNNVMLMHVFTLTFIWPHRIKSDHNIMLKQDVINAHVSQHQNNAHAVYYQSPIILLILFLSYYNNDLCIIACIRSTLSQYIIKQHAYR